MISQLLPQNAPWVALDTETSGFHPDDGARVACVAVTWPTSGVAQPTLQTEAFPFDQGVRDKIEFAPISLFEQTDPNCNEEEWIEFTRWALDQQLVFHNAKYDLWLMRTGTRHWPGIELESAFHWDTMIAQFVISPIEEVGLDAVAKRYELGEGKYGQEELKAWLKRNRYPTGRYDLVPWEVAEPYVKTDTELTALLYLRQRGLLDSGLGVEAGAGERIQREFELLHSLYSMETRGILYDGERSIKAAEMLEQRAAAIAAQLPFDGTNINSAKAYFFGTKGLRADRVTEKGNPTLDEEQTRKWAGEGVEWAAEYTALAKAQRAVSMWYRGYAEKIGIDGRLRCNFKQTKVKSGRMSVDRVNLQAMPKGDKYQVVGEKNKLAIYEGVPEVRELLLAPKGKGLWSLDLSQAELRVAAKYSNCVPMLERLQAGVDFHGETTKDVLHVQPDAEDWKLMRDIGKRLTFSAIFMVGGETMRATLAKAADIHLPVEECDSMVKQWRAVYPQIAWTHRKAERFFTNKGYVRILPNTPYESKSWLSTRDDPRTGWSRIVQGSLAEAFKLLMIGTEQRWPGHLLLTIHDSLVMEMPLDEGDQIAAEVAEWGSALATDLFGIEMKIDIDRWAQAPEAIVA